MSDIETVTMERLKALDPKRPIREADMCDATRDVCFGPLTSDLRLDALQQSSLRYLTRPAAAYAI